MQNDFLGPHKHCWSTSRPPQALTICKPTQKRHNENIKQREDSVPQTSVGQGYGGSSQAQALFQVHGAPSLFFQSQQSF